MLPVLHLRWLAIVVGAVFSMVLGGILYAPPVLGTRWAELVGLRMDRVDQAARTRGLVQAIVFAIVLNVAFAVLVQWTGAAGIGEGFLVGLLAWAAFALTIIGVHNAFEDRSPQLTLIYGGHHLFEYLVLGALYAAWA